LLQSAVACLRGARSIRGSPVGLEHLKLTTSEGHAGAFFSLVKHLCPASYHLVLGVVARGAGHPGDE